jgi:hypothetical protein
MAAVQPGALAPGPDVTNKQTGDWRRLHNRELYDLYSTPNIIWVIKPRMRWAGRVAEVRETGEVHKGFCWRDLRKTDHLEDTGLDSRRIMKRIRKKWDEGAWTGLISLRIGTGGGRL